ncbi:MAG: DMT family transporter [Sedimentisphaerales bacterium]
MMNFNYRPIAHALLASALFAASVPFSKILLRDVEPVMLAALLYLGSGVGLLLHKAVVRKIKPSSEAGLIKTDVPWLVGAMLAGGIAAPIVLMLSLRITPASTASLLLNFEGVATSLIAAVMFREALGKRIWIAIAVITVASIILTWNRTSPFGFSVGTLGILVACALWGLDNNFIRRISAKDPTTITILKGLVAGSFSLCLAFALNNHLPSVKHILMAAAIGFFSYGMSIVFFISAMRILGAGRTSTYFGTAPFIGALFSFIIFKEFPDVLFLIASSLMVFGVIYLLYEKHEHIHAHDETEHEHGHGHDEEHHLHEHETASNGFHSFRHKHCAITHAHPHTPDIHHRHEH